MALEKLEAGSNVGRVSIAAFDVDGTLFSNRAMQTVFLRVLHSSGLFGRALLARVVAIYLLHQLGLMDASAVRRRWLAMFDGLHSEQAHLLADGVAVELLPLVRQDARAEIAIQQLEGLFVMLVSASPNLVVSVLAERLGADGYLATELLVVDGHFRGVLSGPLVLGSQKWVSLSVFANNRFGRGNWELARAYGDSPDDIALLERAKQAVVVNAHGELARAAALRGWQQVYWS